MAYKKRFDARKLELRDPFRMTLTVAVVVAIATYTNWLLALFGFAMPLLGWYISSLSLRAKTEAGSLRLANCSAMILAFWVVFRAVPMLIWTLLAFLSGTSPGGL